MTTTGLTKDTSFCCWLKGTITYTTISAMQCALKRVCLEMVCPEQVCPEDTSRTGSRSGNLDKLRSSVLSSAQSRVKAGKLDDQSTCRRQLVRYNSTCRHPFEQLVFCCITRKIPLPAPLSDTALELLFVLASSCARTCGHMLTCL